MKLIDLLKIKAGVSKSADDIKKSITEATNNTKAALNAAWENNRSSEAHFSVRDALRIVYCLMLIDGSVAEEEEEKFGEIGLACDQDFDTYKKELIDECIEEAQSETAQGVEFISLESEEDEEYYAQIHDYVGSLIREENFYRTEGVRAKELIWNLLAIAYSEGEYSENEKKLIRYIAAKSGVDNTVLLEMENALNTLTEIEKEEELLRASGMPEKVSEERTAELSNRRSTIMQGINAMLSD